MPVMRYEYDSNTGRNHDADLGDFVRFPYEVATGIAINTTAESNRLFPGHFVLSGLYMALTRPLTMQVALAPNIDNM